MIKLGNSNSNFNSNKICALSSAEIRLEKDLLELKYYRLSTKIFNTTFSNIFINTNQENYSLFVNFTNKFTNISYQFCLIFPNDYPFSPPKIKIVDSNSSQITCSKLIFKLIMKDGWNPILSINSIVYALELMLYDPSSEDEITPLKLFESENKLKIDNTVIIVDYPLEYTYSPRLVEQKFSNFTEINYENIYTRKIFHQRSKRLYKEMEGDNYSSAYFILPSMKKLKISSVNNYF